MGLRSDLRQLASGCEEVVKVCRVGARAKLGQRPAEPLQTPMAWVGCVNRGTFELAGICSDHGCTAWSMCEGGCGGS